MSLSFQSENSYKMKWWGWGAQNLRASLKDRPGVFPYLQKNLGLDKYEPVQTFSLSEPRPPKSLLPQAIVDEFIQFLGEKKCFTDDLERVVHCYGKSYKDLVRIRNGIFENVPDIVLYPANDKDIKIIFDLCIKHRVSLTPFGGGTSVVGGVDCLKGDANYSCSVDLTSMKGLIRFDEKSQIAEFEAGIFGPELEKILGEKGYTLGHFPQSFEFSTLGGWIAARSSGQNSILYGGIEKLIQSVKVLTPVGEIRL